MVEWAVVDLPLDDDGQTFNERVHVFPFVLVRYLRFLNRVVLRVVQSCENRQSSEEMIFAAALIATEVMTFSMMGKVKKSMEKFLDD